jgi:hypothetical protein
MEEDCLRCHVDDEARQLQTIDDVIEYLSRSSAAPAVLSIALFPLSLVSERPICYKISSV